jgi:hypothetical protein
MREALIKIAGYAVHIGALVLMLCSAIITAYLAYLVLRMLF